MGNSDDRRTRLDERQQCKSPDYYDRGFHIPLICRHLVQVPDLDFNQDQLIGIGHRTLQPVLLRSAI
jgi:hypothetical protein